MGDVVDAAIAAGKINMDAMDDLSSMIKFTLTNASNERKYRSDLMRDMVQSAQTFRQQEMDEFFKTKELDLRGKQLQLDSQYKNEALNINRLKLTVDQQKADTDEARVNAIQSRYDRAEKNNDYLRGLNQQGGYLETSVKEEEAAIKLEASSLEDQVKRMNTYERWKDKDDPNGLQSRLNNISTKSFKALSEKKAQLDKINNERNWVSTGGEPGRFMPIPKANNDTSFIRGFSSGSSNNTSADGSPGLLPNQGWELSGDRHTQDERAGQLLRIEKIDELDKIDRLIGQEPIDKYYNDLSPEQEKKIRDEKDGKVFSMIYDSSVPLGDVKYFYQELSPEGKINLSKNKNTSELGFLLDFGSSNNYIPPKSYNIEDAPKMLLENYVRSGGDPLSLSNIKVEAINALVELRAKASVGIFNETIGGVNQAFNLETDEQKTKFVADGYNRWVNDRFTTKQKIVEDQQEKDIISGAAFGISPTGEIKGAKANNARMTEQEESTALDNMLKQYDLSPDAINAEKARKEDIEAYDKFHSNFIKSDENGGGFSRVAFAEFGKQNPDIMYSLLGSDIEDYMGSGDIDFSEIKTIDGRNEKKFIEKMKTLKPLEAYKVFKQFSLKQKK